MKRGSRKTEYMSTTNSQTPSIERIEVLKNIVTFLNEAFSEHGNK
jgi:hypothetical protein